METLSPIYRAKRNGVMLQVWSEHTLVVAYATVGLLNWESLQLFAFEHFTCLVT
jgi:hypothetical protein